jgi:16S rRNA (guanine527-N7)-methyltransferase
MKDLAQMAHSMLGLHLTPNQIASFIKYEQELIEWNQRFNLTAIDDPQKIRVKHFLDSLTCTLVMREKIGDRIIDIGTGAGFPGIPLKIVFPALQLTLVESVGKKKEFCQHVVNLLGLERVEVVQERAEVIGGQEYHRQQYDWALARAVAGMPTLMEYLLPMVQIGGYALAMKGESGPAETQDSEYAMQLMGGHLHQVTQVSLPGVEDERYLILVKKVAATPDRFPRRVGLPAKRPLIRDRNTA